MNDKSRRAMFAKFSPNQKNLLTKLSSSNPVLSKNEVQLIKNGLNGSSGGEKTQEFADKARDLISEKYHQGNTVKIDDVYTRQGLDWLRKSAQQKMMGNREKDAVEDFKQFGLTGFRNVNYYGGKGFTPVFDVEGNSSDFQYSYNNGKLDISG